MQSILNNGKKYTRNYKYLNKFWSYIKMTYNYYDIIVVENC